MLKRFRIGRFILCITLILIMTIPTMSFAEEPEENTEKQSPLETNDKFKARESIEKREEGFLDIIEKYSPETLDDWKEAIETRKELIKEIREMRAEKIDNKKGKFNDERKDKIDEFKKLKEEKIQELKEKIDNGKLSEEEAKTEFKEFMENQKSKFKDNREQLSERRNREKTDEWKSKRKEKIEKMKAKREEVRETRKKLIEAIESDDSETVSEILGSMLSEFKKTNDLIENKIEEYKNNKIDIITSMVQ
ncbi:hypothetical protein [Sporosalibacterium faouarense]|uniref:hypothetical protein n=1 Tax=Sporosalibacterium faouarense TaxID=516123 RepID=UPI00192CC503|nr:hypothetical protein [Sporosalibacterium faouarense]